MYGVKGAKHDGKLNGITTSLVLLDLLHARKVSLLQLRCSTLNFLAIRTHFVPSVRKSAPRNDMNPSPAVVTRFRSNNCSLCLDLLAINGNSAFCFQRFYRYQTKALQPPLAGRSRKGRG